MISEIRRGPAEKCLTEPPPFFIQGVLPQSIGGRIGVVSLHVVCAGRSSGESGPGRTGRVGRERGRVMSVCGFGASRGPGGLFFAFSWIGRGAIARARRSDGVGEWPQTGPIADGRWAEMERRCLGSWEGQVP